MTLMDRVKDVSKSKGLSLTEVATKAGIGEKSIYAWKTREPTVATLEKVANVLNVSVDYLIGRTDVMNPYSNESEKDIDIKNALENDIMLAFDGKPISDKYKRIILELLSEED